MTGSPSLSPAAAAAGVDARAGHSWLLEAFVRRTPRARRAVVASPDALVLAASRGPADESDVLAAAAAGLASLTRGVTRLAGTGEVIQTIVEAEAGFVLVASLDSPGASDGGESVLVVLTGPDADIGDVGYAMTILASQLRRTLDTGRLAAAPPHATPAPTGPGP